MPTDTAFRLSTYLTLAVACAALGSAEAGLLPEVGVFAGLVVVALAVIYRLETRVPLLSIPAANNLGAVIAVAGIVWAGYRIVREAREPAFASVGWAMFVVILIAPVLMAAVAAKLLRREKHAGDYWYLHVAALGVVVLAGAMARSPLDYLLIAGYAVCAVWSLARFFPARTVEAPPDTPEPPAPAAGPARAVTTGAPAGRYGLARPVGWFATAAAAASCLYLLTPKSPFARWEFASTRIEVGYAADQMIDLTRTGNLEENNEVAFEVEAAEADGRPKTDLNPNQLWRGTVMTQYAHGRWQRDAQPVFPRVADPPRLVTPWTPPDLGRGEYRLTFAVPTRLRSQFLSAPVAWDPGEPPPVADITPDGRFVPWYTLNDGSFLRLPGFAVGGPVTRYVQYTRPAAEPGLGPGFALAGEAKPVLVHNPVPGVKAYASQLLDRLIREGQLPAAASTPDPVRLHLAPEYHEPVARAFARHLSESPEFTYTTTLRRERKSLDPVEEFLIHTRAGHCERFATALVLMLRSQGIPAVLVLGFRGCEPVDGGRYEVRQEHAHAWTNVLISRPGPGASRVWHWLSLDATPNRSAETGLPAAHDGTWWGRAAAAVREYVSRNVVNATPEQRLRALGELAGHLTDGWALAGFAGVGVAVVLVRAARRTGSRPARAPASARWFDRLLTALARHGYAPRPGETPREFAARVAVDLRSSPATVELADVPLEWADAYYRARFGGATVPDERRAELETRLDALRRALAG